MIQYDQIPPQTQLACQSLLLKEGGQPPADPQLQPPYIACYIVRKRFDAIALPDVILAINTRERESSEEAVTDIKFGNYLLT